MKFLDQVTEHTFFCCKLLTQLKIQIEIYRFLENKNKAFLEFFFFFLNSIRLKSSLELHKERQSRSLEQPSVITITTASHELA